MRYGFISVEKANYPLIMLCQVMKVARSGYYAWRNRRKSPRQEENEKLIPLVMEIHLESKGSYGSRRMAKALTGRGIPCGRVRAKTLMRLAGVSVKRKKRFKVTTDSKHNLPVAPNLLNRDFEAKEPNRAWVGGYHVPLDPRGLALPGGGPGPVLPPGGGLVHEQAHNQRAGHGHL